jgi:diguanylate cyclase (GGDEF)-like protein/PAS domain S-box-containing protein
MALSEQDDVPDNLLKRYFEHSPLALIRFDRSMQIVGWSDRAEAMFGWRFDEVRGRTFDDIRIVYPEDRPAVGTVVHDLTSGRVAWNASDNRNVRKDGAVIHCRWFNVYRTEGEFAGLTSLVEDVTEVALAHTALEVSEERFRSIFDNNPDPMIAFDADGTVTRANAAACRVIETEPQRFVGTTLGDVVAEADLTTALAAFNRALSGLAGGTDLRIRRANGESFAAFVTMIPTRFRDVSSGVHVHVRDMRPVLAQQRQIAAHAERIRDLYLSAAAANETAEEQISATIEAGFRMLGMTSVVVYDAEADAIIESRGDPISVELARLAIASDGAIVIDDLRGADADAFEETGNFTAFLGTPITVGGTRFGSLCFADRRKRRAAFDEVDRDLVQLMGALVGSAIERGRSRARLRTLAYTDTVTGLPNRAWLIEHLRDRLEKAAQGGSSISVLFLDLDRFKDINDTLGHESGDTLLRIVGERLKKAIRTQDLVARMGGDEFVVLALDAADTAALAALAERIIAAIEEPLELGGLEHFVTTSIGLASFPADGRDADTLVKHADVAMYRAKDRGRNTYQFFTPALNAALHTRLTQEKTLRRAIETREFVVYYQPQHALDTGELVAVEALVRWNHPRLGIILPAQFIPNAEISGLIVALGDFVLETACADIAALRKTIAPGLRVAVNLSARQFHQQQLAAKVADIVERTGLDPHALELEITESVAMNDAELSVNIMREFGAGGVRLAVDDFGTGYSSLGYLRRFPLDSVKIDRSFVTDLNNEPDDATIVRTVIAMAHALDLEVIAEGVETADQLAFLREQRCDLVQGFLFSPAIPRAQLESYVLARTTQSAAG